MKKCEILKTAYCYHLCWFTFRYQDIGIRIEDDILITQKGPVVLTSECPKEIDELEMIVGNAVK